MMIIHDDNPNRGLLVGVCGGGGGGGGGGGQGRGTG